MRTTLGALFALIAGYALSAAVSTGLALALPWALGMSRAEAVVLSSMSTSSKSSSPFARRRRFPAAAWICTPRWGCWPCPFTS